MVKRGLMILALLFFFGTSFSQEKSKVTLSDSNTEKLNGYIDSYLSMTPLQSDSLIKASDYLIAFSDDSLVKSHITQYLFNKFYRSTLMGLESVAIHIAKNYYLNGKMVWPNKIGFVALQLYVEFNENSLLGMYAPPLLLNDPNGSTISLYDIESEYTLVYFFDDKCSVCKKELPKLKEIVKNYKSLGLKVYAVYTESDKDNFTEFIKKEFSDTTLSSNWVFTWDPLLESNFQKLYNVMKTPQMFLLDKRKKIIGRNLNDQALDQLLKSETDAKEKHKKDLDSFVENYLPNFDLSDTTNLRAAFEPLFNKTIKASNPDIYTDIFFSFFEKLWRSHEEVGENAALFLAQNYILPNSDLWWDKEIPNQYVPKIVNRIISNKPGAIANDFELYTKRNKPLQLSSIKSEYTVLYFYSPSCAICSPFSMELKKIYKSLKKRGVTVIAIDVSSGYNGFKNYLKKMKSPWLSLWIGESDYMDLYYKFEIDEVPMIYLLDQNRQIIAKKINTITLDKLVK